MKCMRVGLTEKRPPHVAEVKDVKTTLSFVFLAVLFAATSQMGTAQQRSAFVRLDRVTASHALPNGIEIRSGSALMQITALREDVLRVRVGPAGQFPEDASWAVLPSSRTSSINVAPGSNGAGVGFKTAKLHVSIHKDPFGLTVTDDAGHVILQDLPGRPIEYHGASFRVYLKSPMDEHYFGLGD